MTKNEIQLFLDTEMSRLGLSKKTIPVYTTWVYKLMDFYPGRNLESIKFNEIQDFLNHHVQHTRYSPSSINIAFNALILLYNRLWRKNYPIERIVKPRPVVVKREYLGEHEILSLLAVTTNLKHKAMLTIAYSAGLEVGQIKNIRLEDVDYKRSHIQVRDGKGKYYRRAILAESAKTILAEYLKEYKPKQFLFEGATSGKKYAETTLNNILSQNLVKAGIHRKMTFRALKYSYVLHLCSQGVPLIRILENLGIDNTHTLLVYSRLVALGRQDLNHSPLDQLPVLSSRNADIDSVNLLKVIKKIKNVDERDYLIEAMRCMENKALRAGIIFAWTAANLNIRRKCISKGYRLLNLARVKHDQGSREIKKEEDFSYIKDKTTLMISLELGLFDKSEKDVLETHLNLRNMCGHPSNYRPDGLKAASFISDLLELVFSRK